MNLTFIAEELYLVEPIINEPGEYVARRVIGLEAYEGEVRPVVIEGDGFHSYIPGSIEGAELTTDPETWASNQGVRVDLDTGGVYVRGGGAG